MKKNNVLIFEESCNNLVKDFCKKQKIDYNDVNWVADKIGGILSIIDQYYFGIMDIYYDLKTKQPKGNIMSWQDDVIDGVVTTINYENYCKL